MVIPNKMIDDLLAELGFAKKEVKVYLTIIRNGNLTASEISKKTRLHRPTVYDTLNKLMEKGLVTQLLKSNRKSFQSTDFSKFLSKIKEQESIAKLAIKELNKIHFKKNNDYEVEVFEGKEGLKSYFDYIQFLLTKNELKDYLVLGSSLKSIKTIKFFILSRIKSAFKIAKDVDYRVVWDSSTKNDIFRKMLAKKGKHKFVNYNSECTTIVFNNYVAIMFGKDPIIVRIFNKEVADTYRKQFEMIWKS